MALKRKKIKAGGADFIFNILNYTIITLFVLMVLYPLYIIVIASVSDPYSVMRGEVLLYPKNFSFIGYQRILQNQQIWISLKNTIIYTLAGTSLNVLLTMMAGYALTRNFIGKKAVNLYIVFTMFFSGGLIPTFLQVKALGLYNTPWIMIVFGAINVWNILISRAFLKSTLSDELQEAAMMDGCSNFRYFFSIVLPLSKALMAVLVIYYGVAHWNDFMTGLIYISDRKYLPLQVVLRELLASLQITGEMSQLTGDIKDLEEVLRVAESVKYSAIIISTLPIILLYVAMQKHFVKGVMIGSLKG